MQHLLGRAAWSAAGARDDLRAYVVEPLGDPDGVLVIDATGLLKKGTPSVGVAPLAPDLWGDTTRGR
jgi:SRSO17 transposase